MTFVEQQRHILADKIYCFSKLQSKKLKGKRVPEGQQMIFSKDVNKRFHGNVLRKGTRVHALPGPTHKKMN